jgi:hypothetical protein|tara:strand:+ start:188 stop:484 length:297 start_codon:yes stop_codon:yes gene_type:complete
MTAMANSDYSAYSIERLKEWVSDALQTEVSADEIADAIQLTLQEEVDYHMEAMNKASDVLARLKAKRKAPDISFARASDWADFWNSQPGSNEGVVTFS